MFVCYSMRNKEKSIHSLDRSRYYVLDTIIYGIKVDTLIYKNLFTRQIKKVSISNTNKNKNEVK